MKSSCDLRYAAVPRFLASAALLLASLPLLGSGCATEERYDLAPPAFSESDDFSNAIDQPPRARTLYALAQILANQDRDTQCQYVLARTIHDYPSFVPAYNEMAELHLRGGRIDKAIAALQAGLEVSENDAVLLNNFGTCLLMKGEPGKALEAFTKAASAAPNDARYRANMAAAVGLQGRYAESLALYLQVMRAADAHFNLGVLCESLGDMERAAAEYARAQEIRDGTS